jgi:hypothetical protein
VVAVHEVREQHDHGLERQQREVVFDEVAPTVLRATDEARQLGQEQALDASVDPLHGPFQVGRVGAHGPGVDAEGSGSRPHGLGQELLSPVIGVF